MIKTYLFCPTNCWSLCNTEWDSLDFEITCSLSQSQEIYAILVISISRIYFLLVVVWLLWSNISCINIFILIPFSMTRKINPHIFQYIDPNSSFVQMVCKSAYMIIWHIIYILFFLSPHLVQYFYSLFSVPRL